MKITLDSNKRLETRYICTTGTSVGEVVIHEITEDSFDEWKTKAKPTKIEAIKDFLILINILQQNTIKLLNEETSSQEKLDNSNERN